MSDKGPSMWDEEEMHVCWVDDSMCLECGAMTITQAIEWEMIDSEFPVTRVQALDRLIRDASLHGRRFYTSDGHPIPLSSYLPRKRDPLGTQF